MDKKIMSFSSPPFSSPALSGDSFNSESCDSCLSQHSSAHLRGWDEAEMLAGVLCAHQLLAAEADKSSTDQLAYQWLVTSQYSFQLSTRYRC